jgi:hypothetical protein
MPPGRLSPFAIGVTGVKAYGLLDVWALRGGKQKFFGKTQDWFAGYLMLATLIWLFGLLGTNRKLTISISPLAPPEHNP